MLRTRSDTGKPSLALLASVTAIGFCALHMLVPALPVLASVFNDDTARVQLVLTLFLAGIAGGQLIYGPVSDRFGRRPVLIVGLVMFLAGTLLCGLAGSLSALIAGRVLQGIGACAGIVLGRAIIRDVYDREAAARGLALVMMTMSLAPAISPTIGGYFVEWFDWRALFVLLGVAGAGVLVLVVARLPETNTTPTPLNLAGMARSYAALLRLPDFVGFALCSACASASWFAFCASAPHLIAHLLHQPPSTYGLMILLPMATYVLGNAMAARLAVRWGSLRLVLCGRAVALVAAIAMVTWWWLGEVSVWMLFAPIALAGIGDGLSQPATMAAGLSAQPRLAGTASGLIGFLQMTFAAVGTFVVGVVPHDSPLGMIVVVGGFIALALAAGIFGVSRTAGGAQILGAWRGVAVDNAPNSIRPQPTREDPA